MRDKLWLIIPIKTLSLAKGRLSDLLTPEQRQALAVAMLKDVLAELQASLLISCIVLLSKDKQVESIAREHQLGFIREPDNCHNLNEAVAFAVNTATAAKVQSVIILHGDLPLIQRADMEKLIQQAQAADVVLVADNKEQGTNAMFLRLPSTMRFAYGEGSLERHQDIAREAGLSYFVLSLASFQLDIDNVQDIVELQAHLESKSHVAHLFSSVSWQAILAVIHDEKR